MRDFSTITVEDWVRGPLDVVDSPQARANKQALDAHLQAEWSSDLAATMKTIYPDHPWQIVHGVGIEVRGFEAVRDYYASRFAQTSGPGADYWTRACVTETCAYVECPGISIIGGRPVEGGMLDVPSVLVVDFRDGLVLGETVYLDGVRLGEHLQRLGWNAA